MVEDVDDLIMSHGPYYTSKTSADHFTMDDGMVTITSFKIIFWKHAHDWCDEFYRQRKHSCL